MSTSPSYLAFDLGASSCRAVVGTLTGQRMALEEVHRFPTPLLVRGARLYWDLEAIWQELRSTLQRVCAHQELRSVSVDSWGVDYVPLDKSFRPVRQAHCYRDPRTEGMDKEIAYRIDPEALFAATGVQPQAINTLWQVMADQVLTPEDFDKTATRLLIADYFNYRFSGIAIAEVSAASTTQLFAPHSMTWARSLMDDLGLRSETWPQVVPSGTRLGPAQQTIETSPIEVVAGCSHDTACAVAATPVRSDGGTWAFLSSGTWGILGVELDRPMISAQTRALGFTHEVGFNRSIRLLRNLTGLWVLQECERTWRAAGQRFNYATLMNEAVAAGDSKALLDLFDPRFAARSHMPQTVHRYCLEHDMPPPRGRGALVRLILKSLAHAVGKELSALEQLTGCPIEVLHIIGGGSRNALLNQWTADACGCRVVAGPAEATSLGNLLVQAWAMGDLSSAAALRRTAAHSASLQTFHPGQWRADN